MKQSVFLFFALVFVAPVVGQEHAPTAAQCQADVAIWGEANGVRDYLSAQTSLTHNGTPNNTNISRLALNEVDARQLEMAQCSYVDPDDFQKYFDTANFYEIVTENRLQRFVERHKLWQQFIAEDAQGRR